jgi:mRNA interferase RelE/StbE
LPHLLSPKARELMSNDTVVQQSAMFKRAYKRLYAKQKADVDDAVADIVRDPTVGEAKRGDLAGVFVHKFKCSGQLMLLAYEYDPSTRLLLLLGSHENFYRDLKR